MKIKSFTIENFRGYSSPVTINFDKITTFVGANDIGKSTILEALDLFFNESKTGGVVKFDSNDINISTSLESSIFTVEFDDFSDEVVIDSTNHTKLSEEYLLTSSGSLKIKKEFKPGAKSPSISVFIIANHPNNPSCKDLHSLKNSGLKSKVDELGITDCDRTKNAEMRKAIWQFYSTDLQLTEQEFDVAKRDSELKSIWGELAKILPQYSLFQSDRKNSDSDSEVQDPLKHALKTIFADADIQSKLNEVAIKVKEKLDEVSNATLTELRSLNPALANTLNPTIPSSNDLKWIDVFKSMSFCGDNSIPINKRGSGVRRLILLSFFKSEAERRLREANIPSIIYAVEEPETSQHFDHQVKLIDALKSISSQPNSQVIMTTHSPDILRRLDKAEVRLVYRMGNGVMSVGKPDELEIAPNMSLPWLSLYELGYVAYGHLSIEYHDELYGYLQTEAIKDNVNNAFEGGYDNWLSNKMLVSERLFKVWYSEKYNKKTNTKEQQSNNRTIQTYIRNKVHHPENHDTRNVDYNEDELRHSIIVMRRIISTYVTTSSTIV